MFIVVAVLLVAAMSPWMVSTIEIVTEAYIPKSLPLYALVDSLEIQQKASTYG